LEELLVQILQLIPEHLHPFVIGFLVCLRLELVVTNQVDLVSMSKVEDVKLAKEMVLSKLKCTFFLTFMLHVRHVMEHDIIERL
jgi:hypothetical protein